MVFGGLGLTGLAWNVLASSKQMADPLGIYAWNERETRRIEEESLVASQPSEDVEIEMPDGEKIRVSFPKPEPATTQVEEAPAPRQVGEEMSRLTNPYHGRSVWSVLLMALAMLAKSLLVVGGFLLYRRRPVARGLLLGTAALLVLETLLAQSIVLNGILSSQGFGLRGFGGKMGEEFFRGAVLFGTLIGLVFSLAGPVFLLIWFHRRKIIREVESWRLAGA